MAARREHPLRHKVRLPQAASFTRRRPLTAILTLAVGIGANVVVFSVLNGIVLRPIAVALSIASGVVFGLLPARQVWRTDVLQAIKSSYVFAGSFHGFAVRDALLIIQIIVCTLLVTRSLVALLGMARSLSACLSASSRRASPSPRSI